MTSEPSEALAACIPTDMETADMLLNMTASVAAARRSFTRIADPESTYAGIDAPDQKYGGRLDRGGFLGRPSGWSH